MKILYLLPLLAVAACGRFQGVATNPSDYGPTAQMQGVTFKDSSIHYDESVLKVGNSRQSVKTAFGEPNASDTTPGGQIEDAYAFNPDGTKFVTPEVRPRNIALGVLTMGTSVAVRQARIAMAEKKLTVYKVVYAADGTIQSVTVDHPSETETPPATASQLIE